MKIKEVIKKLVFGKKYSSETYIEYLKGRGVQIGEDVTIYVPSKTVIDEIYPWLISIGDHVRITEGCKILTHDFAWSVPKTLRGGVLGASGKVRIGNNVFIGMNTVICRNVTIGNNVIIGTSSVVTKDCDDNSIYAGDPAKRIGDVNTFIKKRQALQKQEAIECVRAYKERFGRFPDSRQVGEYFMLWTDAEHAHEYQSALDVCMNPDMAIEYMRANPPLYSSYEEFLKSCVSEF